MIFPLKMGGSSSSLCEKLPEGKRVDWLQELDLVPSEEVAAFPTSGVSGLSEALGYLLKIHLKNPEKTCKTYVGLSENVGYTPNEIAIFRRDNDHQPLGTMGYTTFSDKPM